MEGRGSEPCFACRKTLSKPAVLRGLTPNWKIKCCGGQNPGLRDCFGIDDSSQTQTLIKIFDFEGFDLFHTARKNDTRSQSDLVSFFGAGGGGRTRTLLPGLDFESSTSANSITPAYFLDSFNIIAQINPKSNSLFQKNVLLSKFFVITD